MKRYIPFEVVFMKGFYLFMKRHDISINIDIMAYEWNAFVGQDQEIILTPQSHEFLSRLGHLGCVQQQYFEYYLAF